MASKIRRRRRFQPKPDFDFSGLIDLTYEDVMADLDPGMLTWKVSSTETDSVETAA